MFEIFEHGNTHCDFQVKASICAWTGLLLMLVVLLYGAHLHRAGWGRAESVIFAALNRTIWALGLAILILSCAFGEVRKYLF